MGKGFGEGDLFFLFSLSFKIFLLWVLLRDSVMGVPLAQGRSVPSGYSSPAHNNTVLKDHCSELRLFLEDSHLYEQCSSSTLIIKYSDL